MNVHDRLEEETKWVMDRTMEERGWERYGSLMTWKVSRLENGGEMALPLDETGDPGGDFLHRWTPSWILCGRWMLEKAVGNSTEGYRL